MRLKAKVFIGRLDGDKLRLEVVGPHKCTFGVMCPGPSKMYPLGS